MAMASRQIIIPYDPKTGTIFNNGGGIKIFAVPQSQPIPNLTVGVQEVTVPASLPNIIKQPRIPFFRPKPLRYFTRPGSAIIRYPVGLQCVVPEKAKEVVIRAVPEPKNVETKTAEVIKEEENLEIDEPLPVETEAIPENPENGKEVVALETFLAQEDPKTAEKAKKIRRRKSKDYISDSDSEIDVVDSPDPKPEEQEVEETPPPLYNLTLGRPALCRRPSSKRPYIRTDLEIVLNDEKYREKREKNNMAVKKSRERKRQQWGALSLEMATLSERNNMLKCEAKLVEKEIGLMKELVGEKLRDASCNKSKAKRLAKRNSSLAKKFNLRFDETPASLSSF